MNVMKVYFFDRYSEAIHPSEHDTGWDLQHIPLPEELIYVCGNPYVVNSRAFHANTHGYHEVYLTLRKPEEPAF